MRNHIIPTKAPLRLLELRDRIGEQKFKTLGGELITFRGKRKFFNEIYYLHKADKNSPLPAQPTANNVTILNDFILPNGNTVFILAEILFVTEAVVSKLHQMHKDKETPPLLAFPWFGAQFLSHAFLALERDSRFTQITR